MKTDIHPDYHEINVEMTDGTTYKTFSTWGKEGATLRLDVDPKTHPAWVGGVHLKKTGQLEKFNNKYSFLGSDAPKKDAKPAAKEEAKAEAPAADKADEKKADA